MNETTYNFAMLTRDYLDKAIEGVQEAAPKVWWYLQWKCWIDAIGYVLLFIFTIIAIIYYKKYIKILIKKFNDAEYESQYGWTIIIIFSSIILVVLCLASVCNIHSFIIAFTPICPIDKAIEIGTTLIK